MTNFFPSSWTTFYGDADYENEQWQLWKRFLHKYNVSLEQIESICDQLVDDGERFAPNQGTIKGCLDKINGRHNNQQLRNIYQSALKALYNRQYDQPQNNENPLAIKAIQLSGGFSWHTDMHTQMQFENAFLLWADHFKHIADNAASTYQAKLPEQGSGKSIANDLDKQMLKMALANRGNTPEIIAFAKKLGISEQELDKL